MKLIRAARFAGGTALVAGIYTLLALRPAYLRMMEWTPGQAWPDDLALPWTLGGWIWLLAIFAWMTFIAAFMYSYSPVHRLATTLQSGLMIITAVLLIIAVLFGMTRSEFAAAGNGANLPDGTVVVWQGIVDQIGWALLKAGLLMGGGLTAWISIDLALLDKLPLLWMTPGAVAGTVGALAPFFFPATGQLLIALAAYCIWCLVLGARRSLPASYPDLV